MATTVSNNAAQTRVVTLLSQISPENPIETRVIALDTIATLCGDASLREEFMKQNVMQAIFPANKPSLLEDQLPDIVSGTVSILKTMAFEDGYPLCTHLWKKRRVWPYIKNNIDSLKSSFNDLSQNPDSIPNKDTLFELTENVLGFVVALINGSDAILLDIMDGDENPNMELLSGFIASLLRWILDVSSEDLPVSLLLLNTLLDMACDLSSESAAFVEALVFRCGVSLPGIVNFSTKMAPKLDSATHVFVESLKMQILEVCGANLALAGVPEADHEKALAEFEKTRETVFIEVYDNLSRFLIDAVSHLDSTLSDAHINPEDYANTESLGEKINRKKAAVSLLQAVEVAFDLVATLVEFCGSELDYVKGDDPETSYQHVTKYLSENSLVTRVLDRNFFTLVRTCLSSFGGKLELHALDCAINLAVLFGSLMRDDVPSLWTDEVRGMWSYLVSELDKVCPFFSTGEPEKLTSDSIYHLHVVVKCLTFFNATFSIVAPDLGEDETLLTVLQKSSVWVASISAEVLHSQLKKKKKGIKSSEAKEFLDLQDAFYTEFIHIWGCLGQLPLVKVNGIVGGFIFDTILRVPYTPLEQAADASSFIDILSPELVIEMILSIFDIYSDKKFVYDEPVFKQRGYLQKLKEIKEVLKSDIFKRKIDKNLKVDLKQLSFGVIKEIERFIKYKENE